MPSAKARGVRSDDHVRHRPERARGRQRLDGENVQHCPAEPPRAQCSRQSGFVHQLATRDVNHNRRPFHLRDRGRIENLIGTDGPWRGQHDYVGHFHHPIGSLRPMTSSTPAGASRSGLRRMPTRACRTPSHGRRSPGQACRGRRSPLSCPKSATARRRQPVRSGARHALPGVETIAAAAGRAQGGLP